MRDINLLHPKAHNLCDALVKECKKQGIDILITQTVRTEKEQNDLFTKGRNPITLKKDKKYGSVVTNLRYPASLHCWGVAFDFCILIKGKANWARLDLYAKVGKIGQKLGLEWGGIWKSFPDRPHFQLKGYKVSDLVAKHGTPANFIEDYRKGLA